MIQPTIEPVEGGLNRIGPTPAAPPEPRVEETTPAPETTPPAEPEVFTREYVEGLRREAAGYRTRSKEWLDVAEGLDPEIAQGWLELIQVAKSGDPEALAMVGQALGFIDPNAPAETAQPTGEVQYLTREDAIALAREIAQETVQQTETQRAKAEQVVSIQNRAKNDFHIEPDSPEYVVLLKFANELDPASLAPGQDLLSAAHEKMEAWEQQKWDAFVGRKEGEARQTPTFPVSGGQPSTVAPPAKTWAEARTRLDERLHANG
jgi:hypothetical protein